MKTHIPSLIGALLIASLLPASAVLPVQNEQIVVTCFSGVYNYYGGGSVTPNTSNTGFVVAQFDTTSGTIAPLIPSPTSTPALWTGPASAGYHNELNPGNEWTASRLGEVFGVTLDDQSPPNIYVGASDVFNIQSATVSLNATAPEGPGGIYKLDAISGAVVASDNLPSVAGSAVGTGPGLGNLCFRRAGSGAGFLYVSNLDDGNIYRVDSTTLATVGAPFDHGVQGRTAAGLVPLIPDTASPGLTPVGRRIWGVKTYQDRLFYSVWWENSRSISATQSNEIWSVDLDVNGDFIPSTATLRITLPNYPLPTSALPWSNPVASIDISPSGVMYLAERYWQLQPLGPIDHTFGPHCCRVHRYTLSGPNWVTTPATTHHVGANATVATPPSSPPTFIDGSNSAGGVAVNCDDSIWATGDMFNGYLLTDSTTNLNIGSPYAYGALRIQPGGNVTPPLPYGRGGFVVDYDGVNSLSKVAIGAIVTRRDCCMILTADNIQCPVNPGGPYTVDVTITNLMAVPITDLQFAPCPGNQLPPGATTLTPSPATLTLGSPILPGGSGVVSLSLPGVPPVGGKVCFVVNAVASGSEPIVLCSEKICVDLPKCPCAEVTASNKQCPPCFGDPHTLDLTIQNIWNTPYSWYELVPCPPSQVPPGAVSGIPSPGGIQPFNPGPLLPGQSQTVPVSVTGLPASGGVVCFCIRLYGALENELLCEEMICIDFPPCTPGPGMTLQPVGQILCPEYVGSPFKFTFNITNTQPAPAFGAIITPCSSGVGGSGPFGATPGTVTFNPPLGQGQTSQNITVCISGLLPGEQGCLCVQFTDANGRPFCLGEICFTLPLCPDDPPCLDLAALEVQCPVGNSGYTFALNLTNNSGSTAGWFQLCPVPAVDLPPGAVTAQPTPAGLLSFSPPVPGNGGTTIIPGIQLPPAVPEGATFCYLVKIYNESEQLICEEMHCITLPRCACATVTTSVTCVAPFPNRQVVFNVTNNTNVVGTPFNFTQAVIIPSTGFSPSVMTAVPNPIIPGASGTFTTTFTGYKEPKCVMLLLFNADRSKCCRVKVCPLWVSCDPGPPKDVCDLASETVSEANGLAPQVAWITNNSPSQTKTYSWYVVPAVVPGCTGTLPAGAFTPSSGITGPVGPGSSQAVAFTVNASSLPPGVCAGFQICFTAIDTLEESQPICCPGIVRKIRPSDPCIIKNPTGRGIPPLVGDVDIIIKNPTTAAMEMDIILFDTGGNTSYATSGPPWPAESNEMVQRLTIPPGESMPMLAAANLAVVGPGGGGVPVEPVNPQLVEALWIRLCNNAQGYEILGSEIRFQPGGTGPLPLPEPGGTLPVSGVALGSIYGSPVMQLSTWSEAGDEYEAWSSTDLLHLGPGGKRVRPAAGSRIITGPDGTFLGMDGVMDLSLPATRGIPREFFKVRSVDPVFGKP
jgi:hypothetical protein